MGAPGCSRGEEDDEDVEDSGDEEDTDAGDELQEASASVAIAIVAASEVRGSGSAPPERVWWSSVGGHRNSEMEHALGDTKDASTVAAAVNGGKYERAVPPAPLPAPKLPVLLLEEEVLPEKLEQLLVKPSTTGDDVSTDEEAGAVS